MRRDVSKTKKISAEDSENDDFIEDDIAVSSKTKHDLTEYGGYKKIKKLKDDSDDDDD